MVSSYVISKFILKIFKENKCLYILCFLNSIFFIYFLFKFLILFRQLYFLNTIYNTYAQIIHKSLKKVDCFM